MYLNDGSVSEFTDFINSLQAKETCLEAKTKPSPWQSLTISLLASKLAELFKVQTTNVNYPKLASLPYTFGQLVKQNLSNVASKLLWMTNLFANINIMFLGS